MIYIRRNACSGLVFGGDEGNRTPNPRLAKAVLCQLSYVPWDYRRSVLVVASCHSARSSLAVLSFLAT